MNAEQLIDSFLEGKKDPEGAYAALEKMFGEVNVNDDTSGTEGWWEVDLDRHKGDPKKAKEKIKKVLKKYGLTGTNWEIDKEDNVVVFFVKYGRKPNPEYI